MSKLTYIVPTGPTEDTTPVRLGATGLATNFGLKDQGKLVKLAATDRYDLCVAGDPIEGVVLSVEQATSGGFTVGSIINEGKIFALADGLQATPGVGAIAVGDYVVAGSITALGTALGSYPKVCKATVQPGVAVVSGLGGADTAAAVKVVLDAALVTVAAGQKNAMFAWRVVSLYTVNTGAVGTVIVIERVAC